MDITTDPIGTMTVASTTVTTTTSSPNGYKLYLGMNSTTSDLVNSSNNALRISATPGTLTSPSALSPEGAWGFALSSTAATVITPNGFDTTYTVGNSLSINNNKFASIPTSNQPPQLIASSNTASAANGDNLSVYYGVSANYGVPSGTYSNTVRYTAIADSGSGHYLYVYPNQTTSTVGGDPIAVSTTLYATTNTGLTSDIPASVYMLTPAELTNVHNGTSVSTYSNKQLTCTRITTSETLAFDCTTLPADNGSYYIYVDVPTYGESYEQAFLVTSPTSFFTLTTMQQMSDHPEFCTAATTPSNTAQYEDTTGAFTGNTNYVPTVTLRDTRDGNTYKVRKLADGNCWMTENLRLGNSTATITLTPSDSDVTSDFVLPVAQTSGSEAWSDATNSTNSKHVYATGNATYGNYYNWYTATTGTGTGTMTSTSATDLLNATSSVCPKGWRLPDGGQSTKMSFYQLDKAYGGSGENRTDATQRDKFMASPLDFPYSGYYYYGGNTYGQSTYGIWWTRSAGTIAGDAYRLNIGDDERFYPWSNDRVGHGYTVRCLADTRTLFDIDKMQEMTPQIVKNTTTPLASATQADTDGSHKGDNSYVPQRTLTDIRDSKTYQVRKLADGNIWMTQNLALGSGSGAITLHAYDSDVSSDWVLPQAQTSGNDSWEDSSVKHVYATGNTNYGNFYNWLAATAGTGLSTMQSIIGADLNNASDSVCARGWRLPDGGASATKSFYQLDAAYGGNGENRADATQRDKFMAAPLSFPYTGYYRRDGYLRGADAGGFWWSRSTDTAEKAYYLSLDPNNITNNFYPQTNATVANGLAVRCLAK